MRSILLGLTQFQILLLLFQGQVREVTQGSHDITANRDMRDALGTLCRTLR
jgi:hypothetical protein